MNFQKLYTLLKNLGYDREEVTLMKYANKSVINKDFSNKTLCHTILDHSKIKKSNFDHAAVTGSMFNHCKFENCSMELSDFEFCEFRHCEFDFKFKISASFNNSTFFETEFNNVIFDSALLTGSYFQKCVFNHVTIAYTTMENALFQDCTFQDVNLQNLNMDYVELVNPSMKNVILPMAQIPYMFGCLQYLMTTDDIVSIVGSNNESITKQKYISEVLPLLIEYFLEKKEYFPVANIYISQGNSTLAFQFLVEGMAEAVAQRDFRMIKFYSKLISKNEVFPQKVLHDFYHRLCHLLPVNNMEAMSYIKNIGEIKYLLFDRTSKTTLHFSFYTNFYSKEIDKVAHVIGRLFKIAKMSSSMKSNDVEIKLSENSPLLIEVDVSGNIEDLITLLPKLIILTGISEQQLNIYPPFDSIDNDDTLSLFLQTESDLEIVEFREECLKLNLHLTIMQYYIFDFNKRIEENKSIYYYNRQFRRENQYFL